VPKLCGRRFSFLSLPPASYPTPYGTGHQTPSSPAARDMELLFSLQFYLLEDHCPVASTEPIKFQTESYGAQWRLKGWPVLGCPRQKRQCGGILKAPL
jgi:hypothetical protein